MMGTFCGCGDFCPFAKFDGPPGFVYTLSFYGGCPNYETPAGLIVTRFSDTEAALWDVLDLPEAPWITADEDMREVAVPFLEFSYRAISRTFDEWWNEVRERKDRTENE